MTAKNTNGANIGGYFICVFKNVFCLGVFSHVALEVVFGREWSGCGAVIDSEFKVGLPTTKKTAYPAWVLHILE